MKKILVFALMGLLLIGCKKEEIEPVPSISWKVGIIDNATIHKKNLALEFQSSFGRLDQVCFESLWTFEVEGNFFFVELTERDFLWNPNGRTLQGTCKTTLADPRVLHKKTVLQGTAKIEGRWRKIQ